MAYLPISLENLTELKNRRGNTISTTLASINGLNYPTEQAYSIYLWNNESVEEYDDINIVCPILGTTGRWYKVALDQQQVDWLATEGVSSILNKPDLSQYYPIINPSGYITEGSTNILTNKSGNVSQWTNDSEYLTNITSVQVTGALGFTPYNSNNPNGYITANSTSTLTSKSGNISQWSNDTGYLTSITNSQVTGALGYVPLNSTGTYSDPTWLTSLAYSKITGIPSTVQDYVNTAITTGTTGNAIFYLTSDKTLAGTALYTNVDVVMPIINDPTLNYTYGWTLSGDKKTLTVNVKVSTGINVALVGLTLLGSPTNVPASTSVSVLVKGR